MRAQAAVPLGRGRFTELSLLLWVATIAITGFVAVLATETSSFRPTAVVVPAVFLALMLSLHVFLVGIRFRGDQILLPIAAGLTAIGLVLVQRLASDLLLQQLSWSIIAAGAFAATIVVPRDLTALARYKWTWALLGILLLIAPLLPVIGREINGARIWAYLGPISFQPGEFAKVVLAIFFASYLADKRELLSTGSRRIGRMMIPDPKHLLVTNCRRQLSFNHVPVPARFPSEPRQGNPFVLPAGNPRSQNQCGISTNHGLQERVACHRSRNWCGVQHYPASDGRHR